MVLTTWMFVNMKSFKYQAPVTSMVAVLESLGYSHPVYDISTTQSLLDAVGLLPVKKCFKQIL